MNSSRLPSALLGRGVHCPRRRAADGLHLVSLLAVGLLSACSAAGVPDQTVLAPWGNVMGTRVRGEWVEFEAGVRTVHPGWTGFSGAVKYLQRPHYARTGPKGVVDSEIEGLVFQVALEDTDSGKARLDVNVSGRTNLAAAGVFFFLDLPDTEFGGGSLEILDGGPGYRLKLPPGVDAAENVLRQQPARGLRITAPRRTLELEWGSLRTILVRRDLSSRPTSLNDPAVRQQFVTKPDARPTSYQVYLELVAGDVTPTCAASASIQVAVTAATDPQPVHLVLDAAKTGRPFHGIGGNFRLQFPKTDPVVLHHNLENLRSAWGRLDLYWAEWDPEDHKDPLAAARAGPLHPKIVGAIDTARTLARRQMPLIVSAWVPPKWACAPGPQPVGLRGTALDTNKLDRICSSLTSYLVFLKEHAGIEAADFSFNEPETGVEVRQTTAEHVQFIKAMGPQLARAGLTTKLLLGDTAHGTPAALEFIRPALADLTTHSYIGAVAFHSWRGCTTEVLPRWADAARYLGVPLLVTETGPDAHLHEYPSVRLEPWFQLQEIELYVRICALAQPATIMEWQLTTDYSVLSGGGVYGEVGPLQPTQRFWNLKQLGATPPGAFALPLTADRREITAAAFGDLLNGQYAFHLVNRGAERHAILAGLPASVSSLRSFTTDATRGMEEGEHIAVRNGQAELTLPAASYTSLLNLSSAAPTRQ
jgi:hypothetical protein